MAPVFETPGETLAPFKHVPIAKMDLTANDLPPSAGYKVSGFPTLKFIKAGTNEVIDYTGQVYNEGMNLDILSTEKDPDLKQSIISETHEPAVTHKGILVRKAKVIIHEK